MVHPTADFLYEKIKEDLPSISLGTVYRNLNQLAEHGIITRIHGVGDSVHFDHNTHKHYHFVCTKCDKITDLPSNIATDLHAKVKQYTGLDVEDSDITCRGICDECQKTIKN